MVVIRLSRAGSKKRPFYHVCVTDKRSRRDGRYIERAGYYNPSARGAEVKIHLDIDKINAWIGKGAQMSDTVRQLVKKFTRPVQAEAA